MQNNKKGFHFLVAVLKSRAAEPEPEPGAGASELGILPGAGAGAQIENQEAGPSPGFRSRGAKHHQGRAHF